MEIARLCCFVVALGVSLAFLPQNAFGQQQSSDYNLPGGWYLTSAPSITANWEADRISDRRLCAAGKEGERR